MAMPSNFPGTGVSLLALEEALFASVKACCAKPMRWFAGLPFWLGNISKRARIDLAELVVLLLILPLFHVSNFFLKIVYTLNEIELRRLCIKRQRLSRKYN